MEAVLKQFYRAWTICIFLIPVNSYAQFRMHPQGNFSFGSMAAPHNANLVNITAGMRRGLRIYTAHNTDWFQNMTSEVNRMYTVCYVTRYNGQDRSYFRGDGNLIAKSAWFYSDRDLKQDISVIENPVDKVAALRGVRFRYAAENPCSECPSETIVQSDSGYYYGVIAQEIENVLPEAVMTTHDGRKAVAYQQILPVLVEAVKSLNSQVEELRMEIATLQEQVPTLDDK